MRIDEDSSGISRRLDGIVASDMPDMEKLAAAFAGVTDLEIEGALKQVELARAMQDEREATKQQVKMETMRHARRIFDTCYRRVTGRRAWDEQDRR